MSTTRTFPSPNVVITVTREDDGTYTRTITIAGETAYHVPRYPDAYRGAAQDDERFRCVADSAIGSLLSIVQSDAQACRAQKLRWQPYMEDMLRAFGGLSDRDNGEQLVMSYRASALLTAPDRVNFTDVSRNLSPDEYTTFFTRLHIMARVRLSPFFVVYLDELHESLYTDVLPHDVIHVVPLTPERRDLFTDLVAAFEPEGS